MSIIDAVRNLLLPKGDSADPVEMTFPEITSAVSKLVKYEVKQTTVRSIVYRAASEFEKVHTRDGQVKWRLKRSTVRTARGT